MMEDDFIRAFYTEFLSRRKYDAPIRARAPFSPGITWCCPLPSRTGTDRDGRASSRTSAEPCPVRNAGSASALLAAWRRSGRLNERNCSNTGTSCGVRDASRSSTSGSDTHVVERRSVRRSTPTCSALRLLESMRLLQGTPTTTTRRTRAGAEPCRPDIPAVRKIINRLPPMSCRRWARSATRSSPSFARS
jgi:hypothetical protein